MPDFVITRTRPSAGEVLRSVAAAFFGVQSSRQRHRDFTDGNPGHYILAGFAMTAVVVAMFWAATRLALHYAG